MAWFRIWICCIHSDKECNEIPLYVCYIKRKLFLSHCIFDCGSGHTSSCLNRTGWWKLLADLASRQPSAPFRTRLYQLGLRIASSSSTAPHQKTLLLKAKFQDAFNSLQAIKGHRVHFIQRLQGCTSLQCGQVDMSMLCLQFIWLCEPLRW